MNQGQSTIGYDEFFLKPIEERRKIFNEISRENKAFLIKIQVERWFIVNREKLTSEQVIVIEQFIQSISPK